MASRVLKTVGIIVAIVAVWNLLQSPALWETLLMFGAAGVVPGTDMSLSPSATLRILLGVLIGAVALIFHSEIMRALRLVFRRRSFSPSPQLSAQPVVEPAVAIPYSQPTFPIEPEPPMASPASTPQPVVVITVPGRPGKIARAYRSLRPHVRPALARLASGTLGLIAWIAGRMAHAWWRLEPRLRRFDRWIERQLKKNQAIRTLLSAGADIGRSANTARNQLRAYFRTNGK